MSAAITELGTRYPPCVENSTVSSPVKEFGPGKRVTSA
jgi:hypothetical protein